MAILRWSFLSWEPPSLAPPILSIARSQKECYKLVRTPFLRGDRMRKPFVIQLALLLIAAAIFVLGASFDADAAKKCLTIGQKSVCFDDGKSKKGNDDADPV